LLIKSTRITNSSFVSKNSQHGEHYRGEKTQEIITRFVLDRLNIHIHELNEFHFKEYLSGKIVKKMPVLIFICDDQQNCFTSDERIKVAATFVSVVSFNRNMFMTLCVLDSLIICFFFRTN